MLYIPLLIWILMTYTPTHHRRRFGWIRKLPSGRWQAHYKGADGKLHPAPNTFRTKGMAEQWLAGIEADLMRGNWSAPQRSKETVALWAEKWMESKLNLKPKTRNDYEIRLRVYVVPKWGSPHDCRERPSKSNNGTIRALYY